MTSRVGHSGNADITIVDFANSGIIAEMSISRKSVRNIKKREAAQSEIAKTGTPNNARIQKNLQMDVKNLDVYIYTGHTRLLKKIQEKLMINPRNSQVMNADTLRKIVIITKSIQEGHMLWKPA